MAGFMGMGVGMQAGGGFMGAASATNLQQMQMGQAGLGNMAAGGQAGLGHMAAGAAAGQGAAPGQMPGQQSPGAVQPGQQESWTCSCGTVNTGKFCGECGSPRPAASWTCSCGTVNTGKFCSECGKPRG